MPIWLYEVPPLVTAIVMVVFVEALSLIGLFLARRFLLPRFHYSDGINDAVSGTVQAIGGKRAARFSQLDRMLTLMVDLQIGSDVPLIQP